MVSYQRQWTRSHRLALLESIYSSVQEILDRIDGQLTTRTDADTGVVTVISDSDTGHGITTSSTVDVYWQSGQRIGMSVTAVTAKAVTVDGGAGDDLPTLNDYVWVKVQGAGGTIFPIGDHLHGDLTSTTTTSIGEKQHSLPSTGGGDAFNKWDTPQPIFTGIVPGVKSNGNDEYYDISDDSYYSFGDDTNDSPCSFGAFIKIAAGTVNNVIMGKYGGSQATREYYFALNTAEKLALALRDRGADLLIDRTSDAAISSLGAYGLLGATYDGAGGASAADTIVLYENGASVASTATNNASYVAMNDSTQVFGVLRANGLSASSMDGSAALGFIVPRELTADNWAMLDHIIRGAAGLT